ncbi:protein HEG homolog 1 [Leptosomus discolor]
MPAACTLLLLLGLGLVPPIGSLPLASPWRLLPPPPRPPPPSRSRLGRPCSPPAEGHAGSPVIESSHQARSSEMEIKTSGVLVDGVELVTTLAGSGERASLPARHSAVPAASRVMGHVGPPTGGGDVTPSGAGPPDSLSAGTATHLPSHNHPSAAGSHHHAVGNRERGKRALASPSAPAAPERTSPFLAAISTSLAKRTLSGRREAWDVAEFDKATRMVLLPSSAETHRLGTDGPSRPASGWVGTKPPGSPSMSTAPTSPSPSGSSVRTLWSLPSTPFPGSPGQPQSSPQASSTQTGANHVVLHPRDVTGDSTSPSLAASPATDNAFEGWAPAAVKYLDWFSASCRAKVRSQPHLSTVSHLSGAVVGPAGSSIGAAENLRSGIQRAAPSSTSQPLASVPSSVAPAQGHFPGASTEHQLAPSRPALERTAAAIGSSYQPSSFSATERRDSDFPTTSTSASTAATKGGGRTLRSLPASTRLAAEAEISTSGTEITGSSDQTRSPGVALGPQGGGGRGARDPLLMGSSSASETASTTFSSSYKPKSIPAAEEATLHSAAHGADMPSVAAEALEFPTNSRTAEVTQGSATSTDATSSLGGTFSSSGARTHHPNSSREATDLPAHPREPLLTSSLSASESTFRGVRSSYRPVNSSTTEKKTLASSPTSAMISATATGSSGRPPRSATGSSRWAAEVSTSSSGVYRTLGTIRSSSASSGREIYEVRGSREITGFTERVADPSLTNSHSPSEGPSPATRSSHVSFSILSTERRTDFPTTSTSISTTAAKSGGRTLRSLSSSPRLAQTTEISTTGTETISSPDHSQSSLGAQGGSGRDATMPSTDPLLTGSLSAFKSASSAEGTSATGGHLPDAPLTSTSSSVTASSSGERSTVPVSDTPTASSAARSSASVLPRTSSLDVVLLPSSSATEPGKQTSVLQSGAGLSDLPTKPLPAFSPSISVPSPSPSASERGRRVSGAPTETAFISTMLSTHKEGTSQAAANRSMWSTAAESPTSHLDIGREPRTSPLPSSTAWPGVGHVSSSRAGYPEPNITLSSRVSTYFSAAGEPSTMGSSHHSLSSSSAEERVSSPITDPVYSSSTSAGGGERMLHSVMDGVLAGGMESSASYTETASSPGPSQPASVEQRGTANASTSSGSFKGFATETLFVHSSKIPTYSSFQNDLTSFSSSRQPVSSIEAEKRTSVSHTDGTYVSTTYTRGAERTLLSISNSSTSADSSESSTFFSEISNPSDSSKSSVAQDRRSNVSSDGSFVEPSTEPLLVRSSKLLTSASAGSVQNTTVFNTDSESLTTGRSSLSSSAFPTSSSLSSLRHSLSSPPPPTYLFTASESSEPLLSSVMASSPPLQALSSSLPTSSLLSPSYSLASLLPLFSSPSSISQSNDSDQASTSVATTVVRRVPSTAAVAGSSPRGTSKHNVTHHPQNITTFSSTESSLPTAPMEQLGGPIVSVPIPTTVTETTSLRAATTQGGSFGKATPLHTTASDAPRAGPTDTPLSPSPSATNHSVIVPAVALTTVKPPVLTTLASRWPTPGDASTMKAHRAQTPAATKHVYTTGESTEAVDPTTARPGKVTEENVPVTSPSEAPPTSKTTVSFATTLAASKPTTAPPSSSTAGLRMSSPATDVDKCLSNPCPALATCNNTRGSYICQCPLGYELEKGKCNLVRIFIGQVPLKLNITHGKYAEIVHIEGEIQAMLDASLSGLPGYHHSTVKAAREANFVRVSVQSTFSLASNVTFYDVVSTVKSYIRACKSPTETCQFISSLKPLHRVGSLCKQKDPECDKETSECTDFDGVALCQCKSGYFKYNKMDHSCRACEDGYKLENETCVRCPFGLGGFNCGNPYQLITVVIAAAGGGLLLIMGIALIVTCCRKNKNDISKLIFKSGDFQMSPYAEYPKNPRAQEWGRETIEMQENGSTKNLLQMTDVYYSPTGLRNPELERNGLYPPYTGLPGSRHSCIYPGQYNPSFISDETRRRDYF